MVKNNHESLPENNSGELEAVERAIIQLIRALGDDPSRPGLEETPTRAAKMYTEMFAGLRHTNDEIAALHGTTFPDPGTGLVLVKDIGCFSFCEHHFALMYNMKAHIAYIPKGRVIGLSKVARIVDLVSKRFQLQERIGSDVAYIMEKILETPDVMVVIEGEHSCMTARGIRAQGAKTRTNTIRGKFAGDAALRQEVLTQLP
jgi:GTP cyclohydrolase I